METREVDVVVIGMGPGGEDVAGKLAQAGLRVAGIEKHLVGGECPYYGCIPSKMIIRAADLLQEARRVDGIAGIATVTPDYSLVADRIRDEATDDWDDTVAVDRFVAKGGIFVRGSGTMDGPGRVIAGGTVYTASRGVVIATGTSPALPPVPGLADAKPWTNREVFKIRSVPASLAVMGGGAIGLELAQAYSRFGVKVTVIEAFERILAPEEPESSALLTEILLAEGITILTGQAASHVERLATGAVRITLANGEIVEAQELLVAAGRVPNLRGIGLASVGLDETARPTFSVDEHMRVIAPNGAMVPGLWAVGDIAGLGAFTHMAAYEANIAADDILDVPDARVAQTHAVSRVTFTDPEVGSVGLTEAQARAAGINVRVGFANSATSSRGWLHASGNAGLMKLIIDDDQDVLVGASSVGPRGGDVLGMFNLAVHARTPMSALRTMIYAYPTFYRGVLDAL